MAIAGAASAAEWQIATVNGAAPLKAPVFRFTGDGALSGTTGCNSFQSVARLESGNLVIDGPVATTRMACPGEALAAQDDALIALFDGSVSVGLDPVRDILSLADGETSIKLARMAGRGQDFMTVRKCMPAFSRRWVGPHL
jgi:heat shock protein HslJ